MSTYNKPYLTCEQQLSLLKDRGLDVTDEAAALACLRRIGYYRLSAYWYPLRQTVLLQTAGSPKVAVQRADAFRPGSSFEQVLALYVFDKRLRLLVLDAIERIEVALRVDVSYRLGERDPFAHMNPAMLHGNFAKKVHPATGRTAHQNWLDKHQQMVARSREDFVRHYKQKYGEPFPVWVSVELWDFGMLATFYQGMRVDDRDAIAERYGLPDGQLLQSWLRALNFVRNVAAHHSRLWNKNLVDQPKLPRAGVMPAFDLVIGQPAVASRLFVMLCILLHLMRVVSPNSTWPARLRRLLDDFPAVSGLSVADMGFTPGWENHPLWQERPETSCFHVP
ncbi:Abi family protein [Bordetella sp. 15P40C-2]|uniref:Abi family protein n=1 Tax=Bordetella sp. 15P40C-2 TaxID=2572246 RepID=UPI001325049A|nr:Abi family protein [Bordetella sp. 15P40C-2]MVW70598.1 Abi family protein [Bordetella sp. 15P40C-2]